MTDLTPEQQAAIRDKRDRIRDDVQYQGLREKAKAMGLERYSASDIPRATARPLQSPSATPAAAQASPTTLFGLPALPLRILIVNAIIWIIAPTTLALMSGATPLQTLGVFAGMIVVWAILFFIYWLRWKYYWTYLACQWSVLTVVWVAIIVAAVMGVLGTDDAFTQVWDNLDIDQLPR